MSTYLRDRTRGHLIRPEWADRVPPTPITDLAWDLLWDIEEADYASPGCDAHRNPACLCDVDVAKTADIQWNHAPPDLVDVETLDDFLGLAARMLLRLQFARAIAERRINPTARGKDFMQIYKDGRRNPHFDTVLAYLLRNKRASFDSAVDALGIPEDERPHPEAVGIARSLVFPRTAEAENNRLDRLSHLVRELALNEGLSAGGVRQRLASMGHNFKYDTVYHSMMRAGLLPRQREAAAA